MYNLFRSSPRACPGTRPRTRALANEREEWELMWVPSLAFSGLPGGGRVPSGRS